MSNPQPFSQYLMAKRLERSTQLGRIINQAEFVEWLNSQLAEDSQVSLYSYRMYEDGRRVAAANVQETVRNVLGG